MIVYYESCEFFIKQNKFLRRLSLANKMHGSRLIASRTEKSNVRVPDRGSSAVKTLNSKQKPEESTEQQTIAKNPVNNSGKRSTSSVPRGNVYTEKLSGVSPKMTHQRNSGGKGGYLSGRNVHKTEPEEKKSSTKEPSFRELVAIMSKYTNKKPQKPTKALNQTGSNADKSPLRNSRSNTRNKPYKLSMAKTEVSPRVSKQKDIEEQPTLEDAENSFAIINTEPNQPLSSVGEEFQTNEQKPQQIEFIIDYKLERRRRKREGNLEYYQE